MTAVDETPAVPISAAGNPIGFGRMLRKEDVRFVRGHGNYVDDIALPGMLHAAILRSPFAHARIVSIDTSAAEAHPKVKAVITGKLLETLKLAWMPTLSMDVQAVLATDKVRFHGQEVAFVVAEDKYSARDALELIDVEYEPLPAVVDAKKALDPGAPVIRDDIEGKTDNHIFDWEAGDKALADEVFAKAEVVVSQEMLYPRVHPARWRPAARSPAWTRSPASSRSGPPTRRRTRTAPCTRSWPASPSTRSRSSRRTSAAASATRSASTPATCSRSSARSSPASRSSGSRTAART